MAELRRFTEPTLSVVSDQSSASLAPRQLDIVGGHEGQSTTPHSHRLRLVAGELLQSDPQLERWSARRTLGFVILVCGGFWLAVWYGLATLF